MAMLESLLDYMIRNIELDTSNVLAPSVRTAILQCVKETMEWKSCGRSPTKIQAKIDELDGFMVKLVTRAN